MSLDCIDLGTVAMALSAAGLVAVGVLVLVGAGFGVDPTPPSRPLSDSSEHRVNLTHPIR